LLHILRSCSCSAAKATKPQAALAALVHESWQPLLASEMAKPYFHTLDKFVAKERKTK
jgi:hypothetical protein